MNTAVSLDVDMLEHLPAKTMLRLLERKQTITRYLGEWNRTVQECASLFLTLEAFDIEPRFNCDDGGIVVSFSGTGDRFGLVWGELRRHGFEPTDRPKAGQTEFSTYFKREGYAHLWVYFTSTVCKRVKVGSRTKTVEEPIFETRCGDDLAAIEAGTAPAQLREDSAPPALPAPSEPPGQSEESANIPF